MNRNKLKKESGYSLVEVLASIVILTLAIIPMVTMFDVGLRSATTSGNYDKARALANTNLEQIKADYAAAETKYPPGASPGSCNAGDLENCKVETTYVRLETTTNPATFEPGDSGDGMMKVTVTVKWSSGQYSATGLVAK